MEGAATKLKMRASNAPTGTLKLTHDLFLTSTFLHIIIFSSEQSRSHWCRQCYTPASLIPTQAGKFRTYFA